MVNMIRRLSLNEEKIIESSYNTITREELSMYRGARPSYEMAAIVNNSGIKSIGDFRDNSIFFRVMTVFAALVCLCLSFKAAAAVPSFLEESPDNMGMLPLIIILAIVLIFFDVMFIALLVNVFVGGKGRQLKKALKNNMYEVMDIEPVGYKVLSMQGIETGTIDKDVMTFRINGRDAFWFNMCGRYTKDNLTGCINNVNAKLLKFEVKTYHGKKNEYEFVVVVF